MSKLTIPLFLFLSSCGTTIPLFAQDSPRALPKQTRKDYEKSQKLNAEILRDQREIQKLYGGINSDIRKACADIQQGCRYDENLNAAIPLPKPQVTVEPPKPDKPETK